MGARFTSTDCILVHGLNKVDPARVSGRILFVMAKRKEVKKIEIIKYCSAITFYILFRQAKDRYFDGGGSLKDYPSSYHMDNFSNIGSNIQSTKPDIVQEQRAPSAIDPLMTGTLQSHVSSQPATVIMGQQNVPIIQQQQLPPMANPATGQPMVLTSSASMNLLNAQLAGAPLSLPPTAASAIGVPVGRIGYPTQPLPPLPSAMPTTIVSNGGGNLPRNQSTDSLGQVSSSGRGTGPNDSSDNSNSGGRPLTPTMMMTGGGSRPITPPVPQPLGLPTRTQGKLVPGRMTKLSERKRELSSTAV